VYAGLAFSLAVGCRLTTALLVVLVLALLLLQRLITLKGAFVSLLVTIPLAVIFYIPSLDFVGWRWWRIFKLVVGEDKYWSLFLRVGRFVYKNITFWSIPVLLFLMVIIIYLLIKGLKIESSPLKIITVSSIVLAVYEALFYFAPLDPSYLLIILPFTLMIVGILLQDRRKALLTLLLLIFISNFMVINFAKPNVKNFATEANYGLWLDPGYLIEATNNRIKVKDCVDLDCYENRIQN
jgi:hypothetical protein